MDENPEGVERSGGTPIAKATSKRAVDTMQPTGMTAGLTPIAKGLTPIAKLNTATPDDPPKKD